MNKFFYIAFMIVVGVAYVYSDKNIAFLKQCPGEPFEGVRDRIEIIPCGATECEMRKNTNSTVVFKFKPTVKVKTLMNEVYSYVGDLKLPLLGVNGKSACQDVKLADSGEPAPCPLKPNVEYTYTRSFPVKMYFPAVQMTV